MIDGEKIRAFAEQMRKSRQRLLRQYPFFSMLMMNMHLGLDGSFDTAATNGTHIVFSPDFAERLVGEEIDFVLMHELMHVALDHINRGSAYNHLVFNIACDIVVNSSIMDVMGVAEFTVDGSPVMHLAPDGNEGRKYTAEEVYYMLLRSEDSDNLPPASLDSHGLWGTLSRAEHAQLRRIVEESAEMVKMSVGNLPAGLERAIGTRTKAALDWTRILCDFVQEEVRDYSFNRPDRRYEGELLLPDLVDIDGKPKKILFMVDTSSSVSKRELTAAYSEICGAVEQMDGQLKGMLGFFDASVTPPIPFETVDDVMGIVPVGGGGTTVAIVFDYIREKMGDDPPASVVIITDGLLSIPDESCAGGVPVLWLFTYPTPLPQWGNGAYITLSWSRPEEVGTSG